MAQTIAIERVDHIGIRVRDLDRALAFYSVLGFSLAHRAVGDDVAIVRNEHGVELNLIFNANAGDPDSNILMDARDKFPGYTHIALRVASIPATIAALTANDIAITQGPVNFGQSGQVSVFVRDPDRNVIELRGRAPPCTWRGSVYLRISMRTDHAALELHSQGRDAKSAFNNHLARTPFQSNATVRLHRHLLNF
jgi:lactoylglutathione lyase